MSATSAILRGQAAAERLMVDTCTVTRLTGQANVPDTGQVVNTYTTIYPTPGGVGRCKVQRPVRPPNARPENVGEANVFMARLELHLPVSAVGIRSDDVVTITASQDPDLVGAVFHLRELAHKTFQTARRFGIEEVTS